MFTDKIPPPPWNLKGTEVCLYGHLSWVMPIVTFFAMLFFMFPAFRCTLTISKDEELGYEMFIGYWNREIQDIAVAEGPENDGNYCVSWDDNSKENIFDGTWKFGKAVSVIGAMTCFACAVISFGFIMMRFRAQYFLPLIVVHLCNALFSLLLLVAKSSSVCALTSCRIGRGGYVAVIGSLLWLLSAYILMKLREIELNMEGPDGVPRGGNYDDPEEPRLALPAPEDEEEPEEYPNYPALPPSENQYSEPERLALPPSENARKQQKGRNQGRRAKQQNEQPSASEDNEGENPPVKKKKKKKTTEGGESTTEGKTKKKTGNNGTGTKKKKKKKPADS